MEPEVDAPLVLASLIILGILAGSVVAWIRHFRGSRNANLPEDSIPAWPIGWVNFGIFISVMVIAVFAIQNIAGLFVLPLISEGEPEATLTPWLAVFAVVSLQLPMLAVFYGARRFYPRHFAGRLNYTKLPTGAAFLKTIPLFLMLLPVIWAASLIWTGILSIFEAAGVIDELAPQQLITLFQGGGDPLAIALLVICAVVMAPIVEEVIFRGCIYRFLKSQSSLLTAQIISGCVFASMHANLLSFVPLVVVGVVLARVYEKTGHLMVAIWFHAFFNAFSLLMLFLSIQSDAIPQ